MNPLTLLGDSLKAIASPQRLTYAPQVSSGFNATSYGLWPSATPGAKRDYTALVGDPLQNYVIAAAVNAISLALPDAPPFLENLQDGIWKRVDDHPVLDFLRQPHEDLDDADVWSLTSVYRVTRGEAFWVIQLNSLGLPAEAVPYDPRRVRVVGTREQLISEYEVTTEEGNTLLFPKEQIIHFRHLPAPNNLRRGWTPLSTGNRQLVGSNSASTYHTALLLNGAVSSWLISMKDASQGTVSPEQFQTFIDAMRRKYAGTTESAGGIDGLSIPLEIQRMAYSPDEMAIDKLIDYYEQTLCALTGVSKKILDLGADSTYLNLREAINDFWERRLVPMRNKDARTLTNQLLPLFALDNKTWRVRFDYSNVPALQENQDQLFTRWRDLYKAGGIDLYTLQTKIGLPDVPANYKERFFGQKPENGSSAEGQATKHYDPNEGRIPNGRWTGGGLHAPDDGLTTVGGNSSSHPPLAFATEQQATDWLQRTFENTAQALPDSEKAAIIGFKALTFDSINRVLRNSSDLQDLIIGGMTSSNALELRPATPEQIRQQIVPQLDAAISRFTLPSSLVVERSTDAPFWHDAIEELKGKTFVDPGFQSTTVWPPFRERWHARQVLKNNYPNKGVVLEIHLSQGQHALPIQPVKKAYDGTNDPQYEVLLPRGGHMRVTDVIEQPGKPRRVVINWEGENYATSS